MVRAWKAFAVLFVLGAAALAQVPSTPPLKLTPHTDWFESHTSALLGRHMTQTYWDCAPADPTFELAWTKEPTARARQTVAAERYVDLMERRPLRFYDEKDYHGSANLPGGVVIADDTTTGAFDHNHFELTTLAEIVVRIGGKTGKRARALIFAHARFYLEQPDSYLALSNSTYGSTGRLRIARMCVNALRAVMRAVGDPLHPEYVAARELLLKHLMNVWMRGRSIRDDAQADGLTIPHFRCFQAAMWMHELLEIQATFGIDTTPAIDGMRDIIEHSIVRDPSGNVIGFYYDVPEPYVPNTIANPWPGVKIGNGNGVELWMYRFMPADAKAFMDAANKTLDPAVKDKFGMKVAA